MNFKNSLIDVWLSSSVLGRQFFRYKCSRYCSAYSFPGSSLCLKMLISLSRYSRLLAWYNAVGKAREGPDGRCRVRMEWFCKSNEKDPGLISASFFCFTRKNRQIIHPLHFRVNHLFITYSGKDSLVSFHLETPDETLALSESQRRDFSFWLGNRGLARRRT